MSKPCNDDRETFMKGIDNSYYIWEGGLRRKTNLQILIYEENKIILYKDEEDKLSVNTRFADEDVWLTQAQLADIYQTTQENISMHIANIFKDGELEEHRTYKKFLLVRQEGNRQVRRNMDHYNLDVIIALGYRVQSQKVNKIC